ncbi:MAG: hypothetical protein ACI4MU_09675 [Candidatus Ventricola sp.]
MKREDWQRVYVPRGDALDVRVRRTLRTLGDAPVRRMNMKKGIALALCAVLALASAVALAAGLLFSDRVDVQTKAEQALTQRYGLTLDMLSVFHCSVDEAAGTVVYAPLEGVSDTLGERLGTYTVTLGGGQATAVWSHDGEPVGDDLTSPVWDAGLLGQALARKAAGEEWFEILASEEQLAIGVAEEEAEALARQAVAQQYGAEALEGFMLEDVNLHVAGPEQSGVHGVWQYTVCFARLHEAARAVERYAVELYADDGSVASCMREVEDNVLLPGEDDGTEPDAAQAVPDVPEDVIALAREALAQRYGLTQAQADAMALHTDWLAVDCDGDTPVYEVWFWLWQNPDGTWSAGDGLYGAYVNAGTGVIEETYYDNTLGGNG